MSRLSVKRPLYALLAIAAISVVNFFFPVVWFADSTRGVVVDEQTGGPIANAAVSVTWLLDGWEGYPVGYLQIAERATNGRGEFSIPGFWPRFHFSQGRLSRTEPQIRILAKGYLPHWESSLHNLSGSWPYAGAEFDGKTFRLRAAGSVDSYEDAVVTFLGQFPLVRDNGNCVWSRVPRTMKLIVEIHDELDAVGKGASLHGVAPPANEAGC